MQSIENGSGESEPLHPDVEQQSAESEVRPDDVVGETTRNKRPAGAAVPAAVNLCRGRVRATGAPCPVRAGSDGFCAFHSPARREAMQQARERGGATTRAAVARGEYGIQLKAELGTPEGVQRVIELAADAVASGRLSANAGAVLAQLARTALDLAEARTEKQLAEIMETVQRLQAEREGRR